MVWKFNLPKASKAGATGTPPIEVNESGNPNGSLNNIAGITNKAGNVLGMMPHPERAADRMLNLTDGSLLFRELINCYSG